MGTAFKAGFRVGCMSCLYNASELNKRLKLNKEWAVEKTIEALSKYLPLLYRDKSSFKIATVENFTGGRLARVISANCDDGYRLFDRGFVLLNEKARREILHVPQYILDNCHYNSTACAEAMAKGAVMHSNADLVLAVSGYLNARNIPAGKKAGDVSFAIAIRCGEEPLNFRVKSFERHYGAVNSRLRALIATFDGIAQIIKISYELCSDPEKEQQRKLYDPVDLFKNIDRIASVLGSLQ